MATSKSGRIDIITTSLYLSLLLIGWLMVFTVNYDAEANNSVFNLGSSIGKQTLWVGLSIVVFFLVQVIQARIWVNFALIFYLFGMLLLVFVLFLGTEVKGATSWFTFGGFSFQPSEFAKFGTALALSSFLSSPSIDMSLPRTRLISLGLIFTPIVLILLQPDAGSGLVFLSFFILLYRKGLPGVIFLIGFIVAGLFILSLKFPTYDILMVLLAFGLGFSMPAMKKGKWAYYGVILASMVFGFYFREHIWAGIPLLALTLRRMFLYVQERKFRHFSFFLVGLLLSGILVLGSRYAFDNLLKPHQQERINVWLNPSKCDPRGSLYNVLQSKMAIGSGGLKGRGFLKGELTKLNYVPEQTTDFIFCTVGEEQGFIGAAFTIIIFLALVLRLTMLAERQRLSFSTNYGYALAGIIFFHFMINIGMTMGIFPIIGIPLPMVSYGGSSVLMFTVMLSVMLKLDRSRFGVE